MRRMLRRAQPWATPCAMPEFMRRARSGLDSQASRSARAAQWTTASGLKSAKRRLNASCSRRSAWTTRNGAEGSGLRSTPITSFARAASKARLSPSKPLAPVISMRIRASPQPPSSSYRSSFQSANRIELLEGLDEPLDTFDIQPVLICVARIPEALGQWLALVLKAALPKRLGGLHDVHVTPFHGVARF